MLNYLPIIGQAIQFVAEILFNGFSDYFGVRLPFLLLHAVCLLLLRYPVFLNEILTRCQVINITSLIILIIRPENQSAYMAGWYLNYVGG